MLEANKDKKKLIITEEAIHSYYYSYELDRIASIFINKLSLTPVKAAFTGFFLTLVFYTFGFLLHFITGQDVAGLGIRQVYIDFVYDFLIITSLYYFYSWIHTKPQEIFYRLQVRLRNTENVKSFINKYFNNYLNIPLWSHIGMFIALSLVLFIEISSYSETSYLWGTDEALFWLFRIYKAPIVWGIAYYMVVVIYIKQIIVIIGLRRLIKKFDVLKYTSIKNEKSILKLIANYCTQFAYCVGICGIGYVFLISRSTIFEYFEIDILVNYSFWIYIVVSIFFFFLPLHPFLETVMLHIKKHESRELRALLRIVYQPITSFLVSLFTPVLIYKGLCLL